MKAAAAPALLWCLLVAFGVYAACGIELRQDLGTLLPERDGLEATLDLLDRNGSSRVVLFEVDGTGHDRSTLLSAVEALTSELEQLAIIDRVHHTPTSDDLEIIGRRAEPYLTSFVDAETLAKRTSEAGVADAMRRQAARRSGLGRWLTPATFDDPLDLRVAAYASWLNTAFDVILDDGLLVDRTMNRALVIATATEGATSPHPNDPAFAALTRALEAQALPIRWTGGIRMAHSTATTTARDVRMATLLGVVGLLLVLGWGLRSVRPLLGATLPMSVLGAGVSIGLWLSGPLHALQLGFTAALLGVGVDYWLHLYLEAASSPSTNWNERWEAGRRARRRLVPGMTLSAGSTALAFGWLIPSDVPVISGLGVVGCTTAMGAWLGTMAVGPLAFAWIGRPMKPGVERRARPWMATLLVACWVVAVGVAPPPMFNHDATSLLARSASVRADEAWFANHYGLSPAQALVRIDGRDTGSVLDRAARVQSTLNDLGIARAEGPTSVIPAPTQLAARRAALPSVSVLQERLNRHAAAYDLPSVDGLAQTLHDRLQPVPIDLFDGTTLAERLQWTEGEALVRIPVPDPDVVPAYRDSLAAVDDAPLVVPTGLTTDVFRQVQHAVVTAFAVGGIAVIVLVGIRRRDLLSGFAAASPAVVGLGCTHIALGLAGATWNPVSLALLVPLLGLSVDYGVFALEGHPSAHRAIRLATATTVVGFAPLMLANSNALFGVGISMTAGLAGAGVTALFVLPEIRSGRWPSTTWKRGLARATWLLLVGFHLDVGFFVFGAFSKPQTRTPPSCEVIREGPVQRCGDVALARTRGIYILSTSGEPYVMGQASGLLTAELRHRLEDELFESFSRQVSHPVARWLITRGSMLAGWTLDQHIETEHRLEIQGYDDASVDRGALDGPSYTRKVFYHALHDLGQALVDSPLMGCTGFMASPDHTQDGHWVLARNFDFEGGVAFDRDKVIRVHRPQKGVPFVSVAFAGMVGAVSGVNQAGIAVAINASGSDAPPRPGTPMTLIVRQILQQAKSLEDAEAILRSQTGFVSENVLVIDADHDRAALFEVSPARVERLDVEGAMAVSNHFRSTAFESDVTNQTRQQEMTTVPRLERMNELLDRHRGTLDLDDAIELLMDTQGVGDRDLPIGHRHAINAHIATHGIVINATTRTVRVSRFPSLSAGFVEVRLDDLLDGDLTAREVLKPNGEASITLDLRHGRRLLREVRAGQGDLNAKTEEALRRMPGHPEALLERGHQVDEPLRSALYREAGQAPVEYGYQRDFLKSVSP